MVDSEDADQQGIQQALHSGSTVEISELDLAGLVRRQWLHTARDGLLIVPRLGHRSGQVWHSLSQCRDAIFDAFLPVGFPHSVTPDYLAYQTFDSFQAFFSTITSLLASRALLRGLGVGDASMSATLALLLTIFRDAASRLATVMFAQRIGLAIQPDCKRYRFLADLFNDSAFLIDLAVPYLKTAPKAITICAAEVLRSFCNVAGGASKAALSAHFALRDNLAELNTKETSQETAVGLCGLLVGSLIVRAVEGPRIVFFLVLVLVLAHLAMNYLGVRNVVLTTLNRQRATLLFVHYLHHQAILSPKEVADRERILSWDPIAVNHRGLPVAAISFASSYRNAVITHHAPTKPNSNVAVLIERPAYMLAVTLNDPRRRSKAAIKIMLRHNAVAHDTIQAWFLALELAWNMDRTGHIDPIILQVLENVQDERGLFKDGGRELKFQRESLFTAIETVGWDLSSVFFEATAPVRFRITTNSSNLKED